MAKAVAAAAVLAEANSSMDLIRLVRTDASKRTSKITCATPAMAKGALLTMLSIT
jgi:hypothetical protein